MQVERDTALEEAWIAKSQTLEVCTKNQVMQSKMEALQKKVVDMHQQLQVVNEVVVDYKAKIDLDILGQLEEQNDNLKKYLSDAIVERKNMRTCTLFAMTKVRQFEAKFESIQKEWNRNQRMRNMMLTCTLVGRMSVIGHCQAETSIGSKCQIKITIGICNKCMNIHSA